MYFGHKYFKGGRMLHINPNVKSTSKLENTTFNQKTFLKTSRVSKGHKRLKLLKHTKAYFKNPIVYNFLKEHTYDSDQFYENAHGLAYDANLFMFLWNLGAGILEPVGHLFAKGVVMPFIAVVDTVNSITNPEHEIVEKPVVGILRRQKVKIETIVKEEAGKFLESKSPAEKLRLLDTWTSGKNENLKDDEYVLKINMNKLNNAKNKLYTYSKLEELINTQNMTLETLKERLKKEDYNLEKKLLNFIEVGLEYNNMSKDLIIKKFEKMITKDLTEIDEEVKKVLGLEDEKSASEDIETKTIMSVSNEKGSSLNQSDIEINNLLNSDNAENYIEGIYQFIEAKISAKESGAEESAQNMLNEIEDRLSSVPLKDDGSYENSKEGQKVKAAAEIITSNGELSEETVQTFEAHKKQWQIANADVEDYKNETAFKLGETTRNNAANKADELYKEILLMSLDISPPKKDAASYEDSLKNQKQLPENIMKNAEFISKTKDLFDEIKNQWRISQADLSDYGGDQIAYDIGNDIRDKADKKSKELFNDVLRISFTISTPKKKDIHFPYSNALKKIETWENSKKTPDDLNHFLKPTSESKKRTVWEKGLGNLNWEELFEVSKFIDPEIGVLGSNILEKLKELSKQNLPKIDLSEFNLSVVDKVITEYKRIFKELREQLQIAKAELKDYGENENAYELGQQIREDAQNKANEINKNLKTTFETIRKNDSQFKADHNGWLADKKKFTTAVDKISKTIAENGELTIPFGNFIEFNQSLDKESLNELCQIFDVSQCYYEKGKIMMSTDLSTRFNTWLNMKKNVYENQENLAQYKTFLEEFSSHSILPTNYLISNEELPNKLKQHNQFKNSLDNWEKSGKTLDDFVQFNQSINESYRAELCCIFDASQCYFAGEDDKNRIMTTDMNKRFTDWAELRTKYLPPIKPDELETFMKNNKVDDFVQKADPYNLTDTSKLTELINNPLSTAKQNEYIRVKIKRTYKQYFESIGLNTILLPYNLLNIAPIIKTHKLNVLNPFTYLKGIPVAMVYVFKGIFSKEGTKKMIILKRWEQGLMNNNMRAANFKMKTSKTTNQIEKYLLNPSTDQLDELLRNLNEIKEEFISSKKFNQNETNQVLRLQKKIDNLSKLIERAKKSDSMTKKSDKEHNSNLIKATITKINEDINDLSLFKDPASFSKINLLSNYNKDLYGGTADFSNFGKQLINEEIRDIIESNNLESYKENDKEFKAIKSIRSHDINPKTKQEFKTLDEYHNYRIEQKKEYRKKNEERMARFFSKEQTKKLFELYGIKYKIQKFYDHVHYDKNANAKVWSIHHEDGLNKMKTDLEKNKKSLIAFLEDTSYQKIIERLKQMEIKDKKEDNSIYNEKNKDLKTLLDHFENYQIEKKFVKSQTDFNDKQQYLDERKKQLYDLATMYESARQSPKLIVED